MSDRAKIGAVVLWPYSKEMSLAAEDEAGSMGILLQASIQLPKQLFCVQVLKIIAAEYVGYENVGTILENVKQNIGCGIPDGAKFDRRALKKYARDACSKIRICDGVNLILSAKTASVSSAEVITTEYGFRTVIDINV